MYIHSLVEASVFVSGDDGEEEGSDGEKDGADDGEEEGSDGEKDGADDGEEEGSDGEKDGADRDSPGKE